jgi:signal transduction histidine kinase
MLPFMAAVAAVLGVLVMGVVLLTRDVKRETELNRMRADLVSGVSHELKAPLTVIRAYAETLESEADATPAERGEFSQAIIQETDRLQRLVDDVVDFSRIQQGQRHYRLTPGSLTTAVRNAVERFGRYADLHGFRLSADLAENGDVRHDARAVEQAVLNLLDNAAKYGGDAKVVDVRLRHVGAEAWVEVRDEGPGIPASEQARIFKRFERGVHRDRGGYGLGLYLVGHVMEAHGGTVAVDSAPGRGSVFTLRFPREVTGDADDSAR